MKLLPLIFTLISNGVLNVLLAQPNYFQTTYGGANYDLAYSVSAISGGFVICGETRSLGDSLGDVFLTKIDSTGSLIWTKTYGGNYSDYGVKVRDTRDTGFIIAANTVSFGIGAGLQNAWLIKTDRNGIVQWNKTFGNGGPGPDVINDVRQTSDGGFIAVGSTDLSSGGLEIFLIKVDPYGNFLWSKAINNAYTGNAVLETSGGDLIIVGNSYPPSDIVILKTDQNGNILWGNDYGSFTEDKGSSAEIAFDGGLIVTGTTNFDGNAILLKTDSTGNVSWAKQYGSAPWYSEKVTSLKQIADSGFIFLGYDYCCIKNFYMQKTDALGNALWSKYFGGINSESAFDLVYSNDELTAVGNTESFGVGLSDVFLVNTDTAGKGLQCNFAPFPPVTNPFTITTVNFSGSEIQLFPAITAPVIAGVPQTFVEFIYCPDGLNEIPGSEDRPGLFPDPSDGNFFVRIPNGFSGNPSIIIYDPLGRIVFSSVTEIIGGNDQIKVSAPQLTDGIYFVRLMDSHGVDMSTWKLIINLEQDH